MIVCSLIVYSLFVAKGEGWQLSSSGGLDWQVDTNGLSYEVLVYSNSYDLPDFFWNHPRADAPVCWIDGWGDYTNTIEWKFYLRMPATNLCTLALFDSKGQAVEKTAEGKMFGQPLTQEQTLTWVHGAQKQFGGGFGNWHLHFTPVPRKPPISPTAGPIIFSLKPLFKVKEPGEYTLHLRLRLIQTKEDTSGKVYFPMVWLPEVVAKVQIRPEDIPQPDLPPNVQTNSLTR